MNLYVMHQGQQVGPFDEETLRGRLASGAFSPEDLSWHEGMTGWKPLREVYPALFASVPPPPPPPAPVPPPAPFPPPAAYPPPAALPPAGYRPAPGGYPAATRPPSSGMPTWAKVLLALFAVAVLGVLLFVGTIFYGAYRVHKIVREEVNRPFPAATTNSGDQGTPAPASTSNATNLNNQGFALYQAKNYAAARPLFLQSANLGNAWAQYLLGIMAQRGEGVPKDQTQAIEWLTKSAVQGRADAQRELGNTCCFTTGFTRDYPQGAEWLRKAAAQNDAEAINNLGYLYENGFGVTKDLAQAREHYQRAADLNYEEARQNLVRFTAPAAPTASRAPAVGGTPAPNAATQAAAQAAANAALAALTTRDQNAIKDALVAYINKGNIDRGMEALTGAFVSRENDMKINVDVKILTNGTQTTNFSVSMPARFQKGPGKETFGLARTPNGGWKVDDYTRELKLGAR